MIALLIGRHVVELALGGMVLVIAAFVIAAIIEHRNSR